MRGYFSSSELLKAVKNEIAVFELKKLEQRNMRLSK